MRLFTDSIEHDVGRMKMGDVLRRLGAYLDTWIAGHSDAHTKIDEKLARLEAMVSRLEAVAKTDKQAIDEVDGSLRQSWEALNARWDALDVRITALEKDSCKE